MPVSDKNQRRMTTIPKTLDKLIVKDAEKNSLSISEQIANVLQLYYEDEAAVKAPPANSPN